MLISFKILTVLLLAFPVSAWNAAGHRIVAQIALNQFSAQEQEKIKKTFGDILEMASEPDGYRELSSSLSGWHYIDYPLVEEPVTNKIKLVSKQNNIVWALKESKRVIKKSLKKDTRFPGFLRVFQSNLIHLMGDLHQPLHCIARVTEKNPKGDKGGNLFFIKHAGKKENLHHLWDGGLGLLENLEVSAQTELAKKIAKENPQEELKGDFESWSKESYMLAKSQVYQTVEDEEITKDYVTRGQALVKKRLALAGYRLAKELRDLVL